MPRSVSSNSLKDDRRYLWESFYHRYKLWIFVIPAVVVAAIGLIILAVILCGSKSTDSPINPISSFQRRVGYDILKPDLFKIPNLGGSFDDSARVNNFTPPLNVAFDYGGKDKVRGVFLGGWLIPHPLLTPVVFGGTNFTDMEEFCLNIPCQELLSLHYDNFLREDDISRLAQAGINHVRIPIGYWAIDNGGVGPPYGAWEYLLRGIQWCRKYGIRVMLDLRSDSKLDSTFTFVDSLHRTLVEKSMEAVVRFFNHKDFRNVVTMYNVFDTPQLIAGTDEFSWPVYDLIRDNTGITPPLIYSPASKETYGIDRKRFSRVAISHATAYPTPEFNNLNSSYPCKGWRQLFVTGEDNNQWDIAGLLSITSPKCIEDNQCIEAFSNLSQRSILAYMELMMESAELGLGWFFMNYKVSNDAYKFYSYLESLDKGWVPNDAGIRIKTCISRSA